LEVEKDCLVLLLSDFKTKVKVDYKEIYCVYTRNIYDVKMANPSKKCRNGDVCVPLYDAPVYCARSDIDKYIYKHSKHYKQVKKHAEFFNQNILPVRIFTDQRE
jgi:hypothetical protein